MRFVPEGRTHTIAFHLEPSKKYGDHEMPHPQVEQLAKILQRQFGDLGTILLEQECLDLGTTVERIRPDQIPVLIERLGEIVTDILGVKYAQTGLRQIARLA